jgi:hypothetical protein
LAEATDTDLQTIAYVATDADEWDALVADAPMGTLLHTRRFLGYHGGRFEDVSLVVRDRRERLIAVFPAAIDPTDRAVVTSHPGVTYGGVLHRGGVLGQRMLNVMGALIEHYRGRGFERLRYKAVPYIYQRVPSFDDVYALFRNDATLYRCDLSCAIDLGSRRPPSSRRRRGLKQANKSGLAVVGGLTRVEEFWPILEENLATRHSVTPVHTVAEIMHLHSLFPDEISFVFAELDRQIVAGLVVFHTHLTTHMQYAAADAAGRRHSALDAVFESCIDNAVRQGRRYFDFGVSTERGGQYLNDGLHRYKAEFGGGGVAHEFFELELGGSP